MFSVVRCYFCLSPRVLPRETNMYSGGAWGEAVTFWLPGGPSTHQPQLTRREAYNDHYCWRNKACTDFCFEIWSGALHKWYMGGSLKLVGRIYFPEPYCSGLIIVLSLIVGSSTSTDHKFYLYSSRHRLYCFILSTDLFMMTDLYWLDFTRP